MADVVLVCVRDDVPQAEALADMFDTAGYSISCNPWDNEALGASGAAVVLWSAAAAQSHAFAEAIDHVARTGKALVARFDDTPPPEALAKFPAFDLTRLEGEVDDPALDPLFFAVDRMVMNARDARLVAGGAKAWVSDLPSARTASPAVAAPLPSSAPAPIAPPVAELKPRPRVEPPAKLEAPPKAKEAKRREKVAPPPKAKPTQRVKVERPKQRGGMLMSILVACALVSGVALTAGAVLAPKPRTSVVAQVPAEPQPQGASLTELSLADRAYPQPAAEVTPAGGVIGVEPPSVEPVAQTPRRAARRTRTPEPTASWDRTEPAPAPAVEQSSKTGPKAGPPG